MLAATEPGTRVCWGCGDVTPCRGRRGGGSNNYHFNYKPSADQQQYLDSAKPLTASAGGEVPLYPSLNLNE